MKSYYDLYYTLHLYRAQMRTRPGKSSLTNVSISWKNPVSWMLCISVKILWDGNKELFTATFDAAIFALIHNLCKL